MAVSAVCHRVELWSSILHAKGFAHGFRAWWERARLLGHELWSGPLPLAVPGYADMLVLFEVFKKNFEQLESWHLRQRGRALKQRHDKTMKALYLDLKDPAKETPTLFYFDEEYEVLEVEEGGNLVLTPTPPLADGPSTWKVGSFFTTVEVLADGKCRVDEELLVQPGTIVTRSTITPDTQSVQDELLRFWTPRWQRHIAPTTEEWERITGLFQRHVPVLDLEVPPLRLCDWRQALHRYSARAARGLDGISPADLLHLPDSYTEALLTILRKIEQGSLQWPLQLLHGVCVAIAKTLGAHQPSGFRPVVIFSVIYRTWSALRSRQLLAKLAPFAPAEQFGFLPTCEPLQLWLGLQSHIEEAMTTQQDLQGLSTDLVKAFNCIPRLHSDALASHIGMPTNVRAPWWASWRSAVEPSKWMVSWVSLCPARLGCQKAMHSQCLAWCSWISLFTYTCELLHQGFSATRLSTTWCSNPATLRISCKHGLLSWPILICGIWRLTPTSHTRGASPSILGTSCSPWTSIFVNTLLNLEGVFISHCGNPMSISKHVLQLWHQSGAAFGTLKPRYTRNSRHCAQWCGQKLSMGPMLPHWRQSASIPFAPRRWELCAWARPESILNFVLLWVTTVSAIRGISTSLACSWILPGYVVKTRLSWTDGAMWWAASTARSLRVPTPPWFMFSIIWAGVWRLPFWLTMTELLFVLDLLIHVCCSCA